MAAHLYRSRRNPQDGLTLGLPRLGPGVVPKGLFGTYDPLFVPSTSLETMLPYFLLFAGPSVAALLGRREFLLRILLPIFFLIFLVMIGWRWEVGTDWPNYHSAMENHRFQTLWESINNVEPLFHLLLWIAAHSPYEDLIFNAFAALIFCIGLFSILRQCEEPLLGLVTAIPYLVVAIAMTIVRQSITLGIVYFIISRWYVFSVRTKLVLIGLAALFHFSAVFTLVLLVIDSRMSSQRKFGLGVLIVIALGVLITRTEQVSTYGQTYVLGEVITVSPGALFHVMLNAVPATLYLIFRRRWNKVYQERRLLLALSALSILSVPAVFFASTPVDRMSLYLTPISIIVWSGLPALISGAGFRIIFRIMVISLNIAALTVWLNFANNSADYVPYQSVLSRSGGQIWE